MSVPAGAAPPTRREVLAAALARLPLPPAQLRALVFSRPTLEEVWADVRGGRLWEIPEFVESIEPQYRVTAIGKSADRARLIDLAAVESSIAAAGARVRVLGDAEYPSRLAADPDPPAVLFERGGATLHDVVAAHPTAAIVGTRRCTHYGRDVAAMLGRDLSAAGVVVVSGLALGIDGAAHEGALAAAVAPEGVLALGPDAAPPVAVVGSGIDRVYPPRHQRLWERVAAAGAIVGEAAMGAPGAAFRFPRRNRIIASLADVVVVVESHAAGGSMHTVHAAIDRGVPVMAVPGSVRSPSSAGTNRLLADGVAPVLDSADVLVALSLQAPGPVGSGPTESRCREDVEGPDARVLEAVDWHPTPTELVLQRTGLDLGPAAAALTRLEIAGHVRSAAGSWERC